MPLPSFSSKVDQIHALLRGIQSDLPHLPAEQQNLVSDELEHLAFQLIDWLQENRKPRESQEALASGLRYGMRHAKKMENPESWVRLALEQSRSGAWTWDLIHGKAHWSPELYRLLGIDPSIVETSDPKFFLEMLHPEDRELVNHKIEEVNNQGGPFYFEFRILNRDGKVTWLSASGTVELDPSGRAIQAAGINQDITDRKRAEQALRESAARERAKAVELEALMDAVPAVIWISRDPECKEIIGNRYGYEFLHMWEGANLSKTAPAEALAQQPYRILKDGQEVPGNQLPMQVAAYTGVATRNCEVNLFFENGVLKNLLGNVIPLTDQNGEPSGAVGAFVDLTERKRMEAVQRENEVQMATQRRLLETREDERVMIAREIHDGPLQTLIGMSLDILNIEDAVADAGVNAQLARLAFSIKNGIQELRQAVDQLRPPVLASLGLEKAMENQAEETRQKFPGLDIDLHIGKDIEIFSDQVSLTLYRICQEALQNVIRHSKATKVGVHLASDKDYVILAIQDNGIGFSIIDNFAQLTTKHYGLTGMKERAEAVGGTLQVLSHPGEGTKVEARIPLA